MARIWSPVDGAFTVYIYVYRYALCTAKCTRAIRKSSVSREKKISSVDAKNAGFKLELYSVILVYGAVV